MTGSTLMMLLSSIVGDWLLVEDKALATLPVTAMVVGTLATTIPASLWMRRVGRRFGFMTGAGFGVIGGLVAALAIYWKLFPLFCLGTFLMGSYNAFGQYYRFAAADASSGPFKGRAVSYVLTGGVVAAVCGPEVAKFTRDLFSDLLYVGSYLTLSVLAAVAMLTLSFINIPPPSAAERTGGGRPLLAIARQPVFVVAVLSSLVSYTAMSTVMTATPLAMGLCALPLEDAAFVIQWHALGMFAPGFVTGHLIRRFGVLSVMIAGGVLLVLASLINLHGITLTHFWIALFLFGVGWNFMFVGGTTLVTETYAPAERAKTQALNDFLVFGSVAAGSFLSGNLLYFFGWGSVNYSVLPILTVTIAASAWLALRRRAAAPA
ncbi:MAG: MFS transporter [Alphaproteobacteria bacterium]|nr:MFS transporter [Alphaproteobacteria bacterium]